MISRPSCLNSKNFPSVRVREIIGKMQGKLFPNFKSTVEPRFNEVPRDWGNLFIFLYRGFVISNALIKRIFEKTTKMSVISRYNKLIYKIQHFKIWTMSQYSAVSSCMYVTRKLSQRVPMANLCINYFQKWKLIMNLQLVYHFFSIHFSVILAGLKKIICYTEDLVEL